MSARARGCVYATVTNILWGLSFIASKKALGAGFGTFSLSMIRFAIAAGVLFPVLRLREGRIALPGRDFARLAAGAVTGITLYFLFEYEAIKRTSASIVSLILAAIPAFTLIFTALKTRRRYPAVCWLGVAASLAGVYLVVRWGDPGAGSLAGNLLVLGACACWVAYIEINDALFRRRSSLSITFWEALIASVTLLPLALREGMDLRRVTPEGWAMAAFLALLCSVGGYLMYTESQRLLTPFHTALFINLNPVAAVLGGVLVLGETIAPAQIAGGLIVLASIFLVNRSAARSSEEGSGGS